MTAENVEAYLHQHFIPSNTIIAVVGGVEARRLKASLNRHFARGPKRKRRGIPRLDKKKSGIVRKKGRGHQANLIGFIELPPQHRELIAVSMALDMVGSDPDSRLFQEVRERLGLGYEVATSMEWGPDWAVATICASASSKAADRLLNAIEETCLSAAENGFAEEELARARKKMRYRFAVMSEHRLDRAVSLAEGRHNLALSPEETRSIMVDTSSEEISAAWQRAMAGRRLMYLSTV